MHCCKILLVSAYLHLPDGSQAVPNCISSTAMNYGITWPPKMCGVLFCLTLALHGQGMHHREDLSKWRWVEETRKKEDFSAQSVESFRWFFKILLFPLWEKKRPAAVKLICFWTRVWQSTERFHGTLPHDSLSYWFPPCFNRWQARAKKSRRIPTSSLLRRSAEWNLVCKCLTSFKASFTVFRGPNSNHMEASVRLRTFHQKKKKKEI